MLCMSAISMMFKKILLAVCMVVCAKADYVSSVNCVQAPLLVAGESPSVCCSL